MLLGLLLNTASLAQKTNKPAPPPPSSPADCVQGCTSNDVQIQTAYLSNAAGDRLGDGFVCPVSGTAQVYLTLELTTNTPRVGVTIFTKIKNFTPPSTIGTEVTGSPVKQCFDKELNQPLNKVTFASPFTWTCGTAIVLTDIFIGWGTGNTNFCTSNSFQCPATPSKCYSLPPGSFVAIETPQPIDNSDTRCSDQAGGSTATFDLTSINVTNSSNVTVTWWEGYTAPGTFTNSITTPASYSSSSKDIYAKITSNADANVFSVSTVTLTVNQKPNLSITDPAAVCSPGTIDLNAASIVSGSVLPGTISWSFWTNSNGTGAVPDATAVGAGTYYIKATTNTTPACADIKAVIVTVNLTPANPQVSVVQPTCSNANGTVTVTSPLDGGGVDYEYRNNAGSWQDGVDFTVAGGAGYSISVRNKNGNCVSSTPASGTMGAQPQTPPAPSLCILQQVSLCGNATGSIRVTSPTGAGYEYTIDNGAHWQTGTDFTGLAAGSNPSIKVRKDGCVSGATSCSSAAATCPAPGARIMNDNVMESQQQQTTVKAFPNPFSDRVKFMVTSTVGGNGNLEIYNIMGQKIKTVYQGYIAAGTQTFELSLPNKQVANLVYVLRVGDKKMTGKILQVNQ